MANTVRKIALDEDIARVRAEGGEYIKVGARVDAEINNLDESIQYREKKNKDLDEKIKYTEDFNKDLDARIRRAEGR